MATQPVIPYSAPARTGPVLVTSEAPRRRWARRLEYVIFFLFLFFALAIPQSVKGAHRAYTAAAVVWLIKLAIERRRPLPQPLAFPMLAFLVWSAVSSAMSPTPILSWDRMRIVVLIFIALLVAQNIKTIRQMKWIVACVLFSAAVSAGITAWQYAGGYGVQVTQISETSPLAMTGLQSGDVIQSVNGHGVRSARGLQQIVARMPLASALHVRAVRGTPIQHLNVTTSRASFLGAGLLAPDAPLRRAHPVRPQGYFTHYAIYAEVMLQLGLLAWGLLLTRRRIRGITRWLLAAVFLLTLLTVAATQTRSALGAMLLGGFIVLMIVANWKERAIGAGLLVAVLALGTVWVHQTRGGWVERRDPGTEYRVLMWQDALRLIPQHPVFGLGMESVRQYWRQWDIRAWRIYGVQWHFHSTYLQLAVERGLPALAAWLWLCVTYLVFLFKLLPRARRAGWFPHGIVLGALAGFVAFLICGIVQYNLGEEQISVVLWFMVGLTLALYHLLPISHQVPDESGFVTGSSMSRRVNGPMSQSQMTQ